MVRFKIEVHHRNLDGAIEYLEGLNLPAQTKADIIAFSKWGIRKGLSQARVLKYVQIMTSLAVVMNIDLRAASRSDYERAIDWLLKSDFTEWTQQSYKVILKRFSWWLENEKRKKEGIQELMSKEYPKEVKWINTSMKVHGYRGVELPKQLILEADILKMISAANNLRDKALLAVLYETGIRASELLTMFVGSVEFGRISHIIVSGKTGDRRLLIYWCVPYLREWLNKHPANKDLEQPLWCALDSGDYVRYRYMAKVVSETSKKAKLGYHVHPHLFRHTAATRLARIMTHAQLCDYFGWSLNSTMPSIYLHRAGFNTDNALLKAHGLGAQEEVLEKSVLKPLSCINCKTENPPGSRFCSLCGGALDLKIAMSRDERTETIGRLFKKILEGEKIGEKDKKEFEASFR